MFGFAATFLFLLDSGVYIFSFRTVTPQASQSQPPTDGKSPAVADPNVMAKTNPVTDHA